MPFEFTALDIPDVILVQPRVFGDARGYFLETYEHDSFAAAGIDVNFVQSNHSHSRRGVLRGLHYQLNPAAQAKLVTAITGQIYDVAVDIRQGSPTYGQWVGAYLTAENHHALYVPAGFAHGYCVLSESADFIYQVTASYAPTLERGIKWNDPAIGVAWPVDTPVISERDMASPGLAKADNNFIYEA